MQKHKDLGVIGEKKKSEIFQEGKWDKWLDE